LLNWRGRVSQSHCALNGKHPRHYAQHS